MSALIARQTKAPPRSDIVSSYASLAAAALALALVTSLPASAQSSGTKGPNLRALNDRTPAPPAKPGDRARSLKPCPEYGAGFYRLNGSETCARIGGGVASDIGVSNSGR